MERGGSRHPLAEGFGGASKRMNMANATVSLGICRTRGAAEFVVSSGVGLIRQFFGNGG